MADSAGKASVLNALFSFVLLGVNIGINVAIARILGPEAKGVVSVFQATQSILLVVGYSVQQGVIRTVAQLRPEWPILRRSLAILAFTLAVLLVGLLAIIIQFPAGRRIFFSGLPLGYLWVMFFSVWGSLWFFFRSGVVDGLQQFTQFVRVSFVTSVTTNVLMLSFLVAVSALHWLTAPAVILATAGTTAGTGVVVWWIVTRRITIPNGERISTRELLRLIIRDAVPTYIRDLLEWTNYRVDVFFVNAFLGVGQVGLYTVAVGLASQLLQVPSAVMGPLYARVAGTDEAEKNIELVQYAFRVTLALSVATAIAMALAVQFVLPLVYGARYSGSVPLLLLLLPGTVLVGPTKVAITYLRARGELALPIRAEVVGLALTVLLNSTLTPRYGPAGAAIASTCSYGGLSLFLCYHFMRQSRSGPSDLLRLRVKDVQRVIALVTQLRRRSPA